MKSKIVTVMLCAATLTGASGFANAKGCLKGAAAGAIAGHYAGHHAGHHAVAGGVGGCIVGRHLANKKAAEQKKQAVAVPAVAPAMAM